MQELTYTVSQLTTEIKRLLEGAFPALWVTGEIVGFKRHTSGHLYFTLKDEGARLNAMVFRSQVRYLAVRPEEMQDGVQILCRGRLNLYEPYGQYKLIVDQMKLEGRGALLERIERLKRTLAAEGLFDDGRKKPLPFLPRVVGIVTSQTGAAVRDMVRIIEERFPTHVKLYPATVQGPGAAEEIARGLAVLDADPDVEVIIVGRGGGAFEDLLPFSDEVVVRAVAACTRPVISAVGHEVDFPLCDLAADSRAATPTAAAQMVVPERAVLQATLQEHGNAMARALERRLVDSGVALADRETRLQEWSQRYLDGLQRRLDTTRSALLAAHPAARLDRIQERLAAGTRALHVALEHTLARRSDRLERLAALVEQLGPASQLKRGYAMVRRTADGRAITAADQVATGDDLDIVLHAGRLAARVTGRTE